MKTELGVATLKIADKMTKMKKIKIHSKKYMKHQLETEEQQAERAEIKIEAK